MTAPSYDIVVIGAGPAGLCFARALADTALRIAVIGSGPSGMYAADALVSQSEIPVSVDVIDRLPVPFGLVRYGVAPDHVSIRSVRDTLDKVLDKDGVRFVGNVEIGTDLSMADLHEHFDLFRGRIGYVPQDDILHADLTVWQALWYAARLRLPRDACDEQRGAEQRQHAHHRERRRGRGRVDDEAKDHAAQHEPHVPRHRVRRHRRAEAARRHAPDHQRHDRGLRGGEPQPVQQAGREQHRLAVRRGEHEQRKLLRW